MEQYEFLKNRVLAKSGFIKNLNINITELAKGYAKAEITVDKDLLNPMGSVHGGCLFSICDTVGGTAAMTHGVVVTTTMASISYIHPGTGDKLIAETTEIKAGTNLYRYDVCIYDKRGLLVCKANMEYFMVAKLDEEYMEKMLENSQM